MLQWKPKQLNNKSMRKIIVLALVASFMVATTNAAPLFGDGKYKAPPAKYHTLKGHEKHRKR